MDILPGRWQREKTTNMIRYILKIFISPWVIIGALVIAISLAAVTLTLINTSRPLPNVSGISTAAITKIPAPTLTVPGIILATETAAPTPDTPPSPQPGIILVGAFVQISGTGGDGLNLREEPGLNKPINYLGIEAEVFEVREGPREADGFTWWYLVAFNDEGLNGWGAANFLDVIQSP